MKPASSERRTGSEAPSQPVLGASFRLAPISTAPRRGRQLVRHVLEGAADEAVDRIELLVSELVTNSIRHGGLGREDSVEIRIRFRPEVARVEVSDPGSHFEPSAWRSRRGGSRYGLYLLERMAERWGMDEFARGKVLWFEVPL